MKNAPVFNKWDVPLSALQEALMEKKVDFIFKR
jgi:hypothetical protein